MESTPPVVFKRSKVKSAQRIRPNSPENDLEKGSQGKGDESPSILAAKLKSKVKRAQPKSRLSFGGDEDEEGAGEVFQVKKSSLSRKLTLGTHPALSLSLEQATISPNRSPAYDEAYLKELKASTPSSRAPPASDPYGADMSIDVEDVSMMSFESPDAFPEAIIPTESSVKHVKERREHLRKIGNASGEDYISLSVVHRSDDSQGPHPESRLMREEDETGEGDDEFSEYTSAQERIALGKKSRKLEASKKREAMKEMIADAEDEDEESAEWEKEQLRRGGHLRSSSPSPSPSRVKQTYKPTPIPAATPIPTLTPAIIRLTEHLSRLTTSHANDTSALESLANERAEVDSRELEMREMIGRAEDKRAWFESFQEWVEGVAGFLDEKYPLLEKLEQEHVSLLQERFEMIGTRRRMEDEDDLSVVLGPLPISSSESRDNAADDVGRTNSEPHSAVLRRQRYEARNLRRQSRVKRFNSSEQDNEEEGYSTDSSLPPLDQSAYVSARKALVVQRRGILADVRAEEFIDPGKGRWNLWRERYADSYIGAWGGLGVVSVWEFWVRLEMVDWDCIEDPRSLDSFEWYTGLYAYSRPKDNELGPDGDLVASMISTAVIPRLVAVTAAGALDPYSEEHVKRVVDLTEEIEASVEEVNGKLQTLLRTVVTAFQSAISDTEDLLAKFKAVQQGPPTFNPEAIPARRRFLARRVKLLKNILRWRKHTREKSSVGALATRLVENCIMDVAESGWEVGGEGVARMVTTILPSDLTPYGLKSRLGII